MYLQASQSAHDLADPDLPPCTGARVKRACVSAMMNERTALEMVKPICAKSARSNSSTPALRSGLRAAVISRSTYGWQRIAPWPKMMRLRVSRFAPSTVIATGVIS